MWDLEGGCLKAARTALAPIRGLHGAQGIRAPASSIPRLHLGRPHGARAAAGRGSGFWDLGARLGGPKPARPWCLSGCCTPRTVSGPGRPAVSSCTWGACTAVALQQAWQGLQASGVGVWRSRAASWTPARPSRPSRRRTSPCPTTSGFRVQGLGVWGSAAGEPLAGQARCEQAPPGWFGSLQSLSFRV